MERDNPTPTELHSSLLRLYPKSQDVRIVTTNFDTLFEQAAISLFDSLPTVLKTPALPLGQRFNGIVHLHGTSDQPKEMILTRSDFGRAYLTEAGGWARRFIVDLFANFTVLFAGYRHRDTIMTYLTPSLPRHDNDRRYALVGDLSGETEHWTEMGIQPLTFDQKNLEDFTSLDEAVKELANRTRRGFLGWRREITEIANEKPPKDDERSDVIQHALNDPTLTRFFVDAAEDPEWIEWLHQRNRFDPLFEGFTLSQQDQLLAGWLARRFAVPNADALLPVIQRHDGKLSPYLWKYIASQMGRDHKNTLPLETLARWIHLLTSTVPGDYEKSSLLGIARNCAALESFDTLLLLYDAMVAPRREIGHHVGFNESGLNDFAIRSLWEECLKPHLSDVAKPLLDRTIYRLQVRHSALRAWGQANNKSDRDSSRRSAIEPHQQDRLTNDLDTLIDIARDCLNWLNATQPSITEAFFQTYASSRVPLLRRLAIHSCSTRGDLSADEKIARLLTHCDIHDRVVHHEAFTAVQKTYQMASLQIRVDLIDAIEAYRWPIDDDPQAETMTAYKQYDWLHWLNLADPNCALAKQKLEHISRQYPEISPREHPDAISWTGPMQRVLGKSSQWTATELMTLTVSEWLPEALTQQPAEHDFHPRDQIVDEIARVTNLNPRWGFDVARALIEKEEWSSHIWRGIIEGWLSTEIEEPILREIYETLANEELFDEHTDEISRALAELLIKNQGSVTEATLQVSNNAARRLQHRIQSEDRMPDSDWMTRAISHRAGELARYWIQSIAIWKNHEGRVDSQFGKDHAEALGDLLEGVGVASALARFILMTEIQFLAFADEDWTRRNLIPALQVDHSEFEAAWEGLTYCGPMTPRTADLLREPLLNAVEHVNQMPPCDFRLRFNRKYTQMLTWFATSASDEWITRLFRFADEETKVAFGQQIAWMLKGLSDTEQKEWWNIWLRDYWTTRLTGIPSPLSESEISTMLDWTVSLNEVFSEAVELAIKMDIASTGSSMILMDIADTDLISRHPEALAKLVVHIGSSNFEPWTLPGQIELASALRQSNLSPELRDELANTLARHDIYQ